MDVHTKARRSYNMSRIKNSDTKPELIVRKLCHSMGYRFRLHQKSLSGRPDLVFARHRVVMFVNGCFWHRHKCKYGARLPKTNTEFWQNKLDGNKIRDHRNWRRLRAQGWRVAVIWECQTRDQNRLLTQLHRIFS